MPFVEELVQLVVDGYSLRGWQEVSIQRSMQSAAISFSLQATNPTWSAPAKALRRGKKVEIYTSPASGTFVPGGGDLMCIGYIDHYGAKYGPGDTKTVSVTGRSKAADGIDCPPVKHKTGRIEKKKLHEVAQELDEFDIGFSTDQDLEPIPKVQIVPGETLFATLDREAARIGAMLAGQPNGSVLITRAGSKRHGGALVLGQSPLVSIDVNIGSAHKHSPIIVKGQRSLGAGKDDLRQEVQELDASVERHRPIVIVLEGDAPKKDLKTRARWQQLRNAGFGTTISAEVSTWRDDGGLIWDAGRLMAIKVQPEDVDQDMTLSTVSFTQKIGEGQGAGTRATLSFVDPRAHGGKKAAGSSDAAFDTGGSIDQE